MQQRRRSAYLDLALTFRLFLLSLLTLFFLHLFLMVKQMNVGDIGSRHAEFGRPLYLQIFLGGRALRQKKEPASPAIRADCT